MSRAPSRRRYDEAGDSGPANLERPCAPFPDRPTPSSSSAPVWARLSAALYLAGAGRHVTVVERESVPGGRNGLIRDHGYFFDTGPTVL